MYRYNSGAEVFGYIVALIVLLIINGLLASNASDIAQDKGYEKRKWFHMCFWLSLPAYLIVCAMPDKNLAEAIRQQFTVNTGKIDNNLEVTAVAAKLDERVTFGHYPQMAEGTDNTAIEWLVLQKEDNKALLISRYGLDVQPYNTIYTDVTWETCTLRTWLNSTFMNKAFTAEEQKAILTTTVDNSSSQGYSGYSTNGGNNTQDQVFLLSYAEANKYFGVTYSDSNNTEARVKPTAYAEKQGAYTSSSTKTVDGDSAGWWWLRSPGYYQYYAASVSTGGSLDDGIVSIGLGCVRPALWINLEPGIF
ncbi:MAG: DUF6273 domain-containing protein [Clostridia bacterium]|nr:DUF6273 domain-containing protein [Clostridia bacterium]